MKNHVVIQLNDVDVTTLGNFLVASQVKASTKKKPKPKGPKAAAAPDSPANPLALAGALPLAGAQPIKKKPGRPKKAA